jgi:hypothetical protein
MITLTAIVALLVVAAWVAYEDALVRESVDRAAAMRLESMDRAMTDMTGRCWVCTAEANPLELVDSGHRFDLMCGHCAHVRKTMNPQTRSRVA